MSRLLCLLGFHQWTSRFAGRFTGDHIDAGQGLTIVRVARVFYDSRCQRCGAAFFGYQRGPLT